MTNLIGILKFVENGHPLIAATIRKMRFLWELTAHRNLIRRYMSAQSRMECDRIVDAPLLIGYFETGFGLGEYARGLAAALDVVKAPFSVYPYSAYTGRSRDEASWARFYDVQKIHAVNVFCMAADQTRNARRIIGRRHTEKSYNILSTFWELPRAPESARSELEFFDELWTPNHFVSDSFRSVFSKKILVIPPCVNLGKEITPSRVKFGLDPKKFYFLFSFDLNSYPERKNPLAVARAFEAAFGDGRDDVGLIFKITKTRNRFQKMMSKLEAVAKRDRRITILQGNWQRADVLALFASIDCFVSLHRSEGFGLGMAEAMLLGKPVIATAFSGNTEFLTAETGYPVPYHMRLVKEGEYPHSMGNSWAEPDVRIAADLMRSIARRTDDVLNKALRGQAYIRQHYSPEAVGRLVAARLRELTQFLRKR
jgi:glycosyltransferase involved in cell wall biosynthesis